MLSVWKKVMQVPFSKIKLLVHKALNSKPFFLVLFFQKEKISSHIGT
jgi:hypothetical protein